MNIYLDGNYGQVLKVGGQCYSLNGASQNSPTHTQLDVQSAHIDCNDCENPFSPPPQPSPPPFSPPPQPSLPPSPSVIPCDLNVIHAGQAAADGLYEWTFSGTRWEKDAALFTIDKNPISGDWELKEFGTVRYTNSGTQLVDGVEYPTNGGWQVAAGGTAPAPNSYPDCISISPFPSPSPLPPDPSVLLTITGAGSDVLTWCGKTWVMPLDSGLQQEIFPTTWNQNNPEDEWGHYVSPSNELNLKRRTSSNEVRARIMKTATFSGFGGRDLRNNGSTIFIAQLGVLTTVSAWGGIPNFPINPEMFGSFTSGGYTFTWAKGNNWPY